VVFRTTVLIIEYILGNKIVDYLSVKYTISKPVRYILIGVLVLILIVTATLLGDIKISVNGVSIL